MRMFIGVVIMVALVEVDVEVGAAAEEVIKGGVGDITAVNVERLELLDAGEIGEAGVSDGDVNEVEALEGRILRNRFCARIGHERASEAKLLKLHKLFEPGKAVVGEFRVGQI